MRVTVGIDRFLVQMQVEKDWTPRTITSVRGYLVKLVDENPELTFAELSGRAGTDVVREHISKRYGHLSAANRGKIISYFHTFFGWAEEEGHLDDDPARRIKRPPKRKPDVYKPTDAEVMSTLIAATDLELGALLLMSGAGLRASEVVATRWCDLDLVEGRVRVKRKGQNWQRLPLDPIVTERLKTLFIDRRPRLDHHVFVAEAEHWSSNTQRVRSVIDPTTPRTPKALWSMVNRVSARAGVRPLGPHMLRRGFANRFLRETRERWGVADRHTLQYLMGHSRGDTTEAYVKELEADDAADVLRRLRAETDETGVTSSGRIRDLSELGANPLVEAAGIEPASAGSETGEKPGSESEDDSEPHKRSLTGKQPPETEGGD